MQKFDGLEYMYIALANHYGHDKCTWEDRLDWGKDNHESILLHPSDYADAAEPMLMYKTAREINVVKATGQSTYLMGIDATASGLQVFAALTGCHATARNVNLVYTCEREDIYRKVAITMRSHGADVTRDDVKKPLMTTLYGSKLQPKMLFGEDTPELEAFYQTLAEEVPGAMEALDDIQSCWQGDAFAHTWTLPDGHVAHVPVMVEVDEKIEVDNLAHSTFTHKAYINAPEESGISLAANVVHSIDGYMVREMVRRAHKQGFELLTIHDSFWASPVYINQVRDNYRQILAEIAEMDLLGDILTEITGNPVSFKKYSNDLADLIRESEYALS